MGVEVGLIALLRAGLLTGGASHDCTWQCNDPTKEKRPLQRDVAEGVLSDKARIAFEDLILGAVVSDEVA